MQDPESKNVIILPKKRVRETNDPMPDTQLPLPQLHPENFFQSSTNPSGHSKVFWTLPTTPSPTENNENTYLESPTFSTVDLEQWKIKLFQTIDQGLLNISIEHKENSKSLEKVHLSGELNLWVFKRNRYENLSNLKIDHFFSEENQILDLKKFSEVFRNKKAQKNLMVELNVESKLGPEFFKLDNSFVGIIDDKFSGFINCFVQTLFHLKFLRKTILTSLDVEYKDNQVLQALKALFYNLNCSNFAVDPTQFIKSLNLNRDRAYLPGNQLDCLYVVEEILKNLTKSEKIEKIFLPMFSGIVKKKVEYNNSKFLTESNENFTEIYLSTRNCANIYECFDKLVRETVTSNLEKGEVGLIEKKTLKFLSLPSILILVLDPICGSQGFKCEYELELEKFMETKLTQKFQLFGQIINNGTSSKYQVCLSLENIFLRFENDLISSHLAKTFISYFPHEVQNFEMQETGLIKTSTPNPLSPKVLVYIKSDQLSTIFEDFQLNSIIPPTKSFIYSPKNPEQNQIVEIRIVGLETILGWSGPGVLPQTSNDTFFQYSLQLPISKKTKGRDLRSELSSHISEDYRLWAFTPGGKNWEFKELKLNDSAFLDPQKAIFIEVIMQKPIFYNNNTQWNFIYNFDTSTKASFENDLTDENLEMLTPSSAKAIVFYKWYDWNKGKPNLTLFKMVTLTSTSNMSQIRQDLINGREDLKSSSKMLLHLEKSKILEYKNKESFSNVYSYRTDENYELTISKRGNFGVRHVIIDNGDVFIGESQPHPLPADYVDARKYILSFI